MGKGRRVRRRKTRSRGRSEGLVTDKGREHTKALLDGHRVARACLVAICFVSKVGQFTRIERVAAVRYDWFRGNNVRSVTCRIEGEIVFSSVGSCWCLLSIPQPRYFQVEVECAPRSLASILDFLESSTNCPGMHECLILQRLHVKSPGFATARAKP